MTETGRAKDTPHLQNIPVRTALGKELREAFVKEAHHEVVSVDYREIELRMLTQLESGDQ